MEFSDTNYSGRAGWREIIVVGDRTAIDGDVSDQSLTERLTDYPDPSENPDTETNVFEFTASDTVDEAALPTTEPGEDDSGGDAFSDLIADADNGVGAMALSLGFAAFLGALHSLAPGHGKTVIGAYLVGTKGTSSRRSSSRSPSHCRTPSVCWRSASSRTSQARCSRPSVRSVAAGRLGADRARHRDLVGGDGDSRMACA